MGALPGQRLQIPLGAAGASFFEPHYGSRAGILVL